MALPLDTLNRTRSNEQNKFSEDVNGDTAVNIILTDPKNTEPFPTVKVDVPKTATASTVSNVGTSETEIQPISGQRGIILSPTTADIFFVKLVTGVTINSIPFTKENPAEIVDWGGSVFIRIQTGTGGALEVTQI